MIIVIIFVLLSHKHQQNIIVFNAEEILALEDEMVYLVAYLTTNSDPIQGKSNSYRKRISFAYSTVKPNPQSSNFDTVFFFEKH
jgi:hypothetical protein